MIKLSRGRSVGLCVGLSSALWKNGGSDPDAVWHHRSDGSRDEASSGVWGSVHGKEYFSRANLERAVVTNGDFTAYVCDSAATRPSSQITLGRLVIIIIGMSVYGYIQYQKCFTIVCDISTAFLLSYTRFGITTQTYYQTVKRLILYC